MDIYQIFLAILDKPDAPKFYRELRDYYKNNNLLNEASAIDHLIENKFKKNENSIDNSLVNKE